jgi:hypothetical protein
MTAALLTAAEITAATGITHPAKITAIGDRASFIVATRGQMPPADLARAARIVWLHTGPDGGIDHSRCEPGAHDRELPPEQKVAEDGLMACNDCARPLFYCTNDEWYVHVDPDAECFTVAAWRDSIGAPAEYDPSDGDLPRAEPGGDLPGWQREIIGQAAR